jgi:hypothetical protein
MLKCVACHPDEGDAKFIRNLVITRATRRNISEDSILYNILLYSNRNCVVTHIAEGPCQVVRWQ